ncbi:MAG: PH domain-containing protein [Candidatus Gracilibacteria bacterium]|nr:PH domain-containing protein [Candidatus Gracilibacteria bacterium]MDD2908146.1 PH domain-containing protein [Candidatus Gracilibacteria bacterium]
MIDSILENNEKVIWKGKQDFKTIMVSSLIGAVIFIIVGYIIYYYSNTNIVSNCVINGKPGTPEECKSIGMKISYGFFVFSLFIPFFSFLYYKVTEYAVTDKRLLIKSGLIGADIISIYYDQIKSIFVNVGLTGKIFGTGSIFVDTGKISQTKDGTKISYDKFSNILKPYDIYKIIQENLSNNKESLHSGRADFESNKEEYKNFIQETEKLKNNLN